MKTYTPNTIRTKVECAKLVREGRAIETFAHQTLGHFNVSALRIAIARHVKQRLIQVRQCRFDQVQFDGSPTDANEHLFNSREIDQERVKALTPRQINDPLIFLLCPPGANGDGETHLLVDGVHRMYARKQRNFPFFHFYLFPLEYAPRVDEAMTTELKWGEKDLIPGIGLVTRQP